MIEQLTLFTFFKVNLIYVLFTDCTFFFFPPVLCSTFSLVIHFIHNRVYMSEGTLVNAKGWGWAVGRGNGEFVHNGWGQTALGK